MRRLPVVDQKELHERREDHFSRRVALVTAVYAVLLAIAHRDRTGDGQEVWTSLLNAALYAAGETHLTDGGACLKVANTYGLPETFELTFEHGRTRRACRVVWRTSDMVGVTFQDEAAAAG